MHISFYILSAFMFPAVPIETNSKGGQVVFSAARLLEKKKKNSDPRRVEEVNGRYTTRYTSNNTPKRPRQPKLNIREPLNYKDCIGIQQICVKW